MISVRVNEILKYLSSDKKRCVQVMEKLDKTRTQQNNLANVLSSSSSPSSCISVAREPVQERQQCVDSCKKNVIQSSVEEKEKVTKKSQKNAGDNEFSRDYKRRRPLTVLKCPNVQCLPKISSSISENSQSLPAKSHLIPGDLSPQDVKPNSFKCLVSTSLDADRSSSSSPAFSADGRSQVGTESGKYETKSRKVVATDLEATAKGKIKCLENQKHSRRKTDSTQELKNQAVENSTPRNLSPVFVKRQPPQPPCIPPLAVNGLDHHLPLSESSSPLSSRKNRKQKKTKDTICAKIQEGVNSPRRELSPITNGVVNNSTGRLVTVSRKHPSKLLASEENFDVNCQNKRNATARKNDVLEMSKCGLSKLNGYKSMSGVAELDMFEIMSSRKKPSKKSFSSELPPSDELNTLDTFDEPFLNPVCRQSNVSNGGSPRVLENNGKWIEVNRRVKRIVVPTNVVDRILGQDGSKLEAICHVTKAHIEQEKASRNAKETTFVLRGTMEQMQAAYCLISALTKDCNTSDLVKNGTTFQTKHQALHHVPLKPEPGNITTEQKTKSSRQQSPEVCLNGSANVEKSIPSVAEITTHLCNIQGNGQNDDYQSSIKSSGLSDKSDDPSSSERCSPAQDLLIGEYSLFEHGLGQPLEKLLACRDSIKPTFAHAAATRMSNRVLCTAIPNHRNIDQTLLAKAPGYRSATLPFNRETTHGQKSEDFYGIWNRRVVLNRGGSFLREDASVSSAQLLCINSQNVHVPRLEWQAATRAPQQALHSPGGPFQVVGPGHQSAMHVSSNLNPNAPDFIFTLPLPEHEANDFCGVSNPLENGEPESSIQNTECIQSTSVDSPDVSYPYPVSQLANGFEQSVDIMDHATEGADLQGSVVRTSPVVGADKKLYTQSCGSNLQEPWICTQDPWLPSKASYESEPTMPCQGNASYPLRNGEAYRNYFAPMTFNPITSSPYNCAFYQHQHQVLAPIQSWGHGSQTLAQAGP